MGHLVVTITVLLIPALMNSIQSANVTWVVGTSPVIYRKDMQLTCTISGVASCCSGQDREWRRGSTNTLLLLNGAPTSAAGTRFTERLLPEKNQMNLIISNFNTSDYNMDYSCGYGFDNDRHYLPKDNNAEYHPDLTVAEVDTSKNNMENYKLLVPKVFISKIAPSPIYAAEFGGIPLKISSSTKNDGTGFFNLTLTVDPADFSCPKDNFKLTVTAGTYQFDVFNQDICKCAVCGAKNFGCSLIGSGVVLLCFIGILIYHKGCQELCRILISFLVSLAGNIIFAFPIGIGVCTCLGETLWFFIICGVETGVFGIEVAYIKEIYAYVKKWMRKGFVLIILVLFIITIISFLSCGVVTLYILYLVHKQQETQTCQTAEDDYPTEVTTAHPLKQMPSEKTKKGDSGTSSSKSGLFSWASCKTDQETVNSSKNSAQPKEKVTKTPTNEKTTKQVAVVKPEAKHIKTDSLETERSYADDKNFESNVNKLPKDRPLPAPNFTPRPLPPKPGALPPITEKKPETIGDIDETTTEKKKKKRRKKEENDEL